MRVKTIQILHLEDSELDAQLVSHALDDEQLPADIVWVNNFNDYSAELDTDRFDLILSDYSLPDCEGLKAVAEAKKKAPHVPFILVTGALGEEHAIDTIKAGVTDYVLKTNLVRLRTAIPRALKEVGGKLENQRNLEALRKSEERFDLAVKGSGAGIWDWEDVATDQLWWSPRIYEILGYADGELVATRSLLYEMMLPADVANVKAAILTHLTDQIPYDVEFRIRAKSGRYIWIRSRGRAVFFEGKPSRMAGYVQDVTSRKQAQTALRERQQDLLRAQEVANIGCWTYDFKGDQLFWTPVVYRIFGFDETKGGVSRTAEMSRVHPDDVSLVEKLWADGLKQGCIDYEHRLLVSGEVRWVRQVAEIDYDAEGLPERALGVVHDLTLQRHAEEEKRKVGERYRAITDSAHDSIILIDQEGLVVFWNPASEAIFGYSAAEIIGQNLHSLLFPHGEPPDKCLCSFLQKAAAGQGQDSSAEVKLSVLNKSGKTVRIEMKTSAIQEDDRYYGLGIIRDISDRCILEEQLRQTQKMEAIGTLAGGIAHDFNNILASILGYSSLLSRKLTPESREMDDIQEVINAANRAKQLVRQILSFSRVKQVEMVPVHLDLVIKEVLRLIRATLPTTIEINTTIESVEETVMGDPTQVHQVLMNLCTNSYHAMPKGGGLSIYLRKVSLSDGEIVNMAAGDYLELTVSDTGEGIDPEILDSIFDPYFTTKDADTGTGLGLSVVRGIIDTMGGDICVSSMLGTGTSVIALLPCSVSSVSEKKDDGLSVKGTGQRILLVDDEISFVQMGQEFLQYLGYQVSIQTSSLEALAEIELHPHDYDVLITDQVMPQMTGVELAKKVFKINSALPVVLFSGMNLQSGNNEFDETSIIKVVLKTDLLDGLPTVLNEVM